MKISDEQKFAYMCQDVQELLFLVAVFPEEITVTERDETNRHLLRCPECRNKYHKLSTVASVIRENPKCLLSLLDSGQEESVYMPSQEEIMQKRFEARVERVGLRRKRRERRERIAKIKDGVKFVSSIAACLIAVFGLYFTLNHMTDSNSKTPQIAGSQPESPLKIELVSIYGTEVIRPGQPIIAAKGIKTLRINDNRKMILNLGTELSIMPHNLGCIVKLEKGEIYTEVQNDGKPFIVETIHGRAVITGTKFNIKADKNRMELAVTEGTVKFEGEKGSVNVTANYISTLAVNAGPTSPEVCDTKTLTAWATGSDTPTLAEVALKQEVNLDPAFLGEQIDLDQIDYASWIEQKRPWFKREFPHIFKFKEALAKEGIKVDYPELLIKSGDLWRFAFPEETNTQQIPVNYGLMVKLAAVYNKDKQWLSDHLRIKRNSLISENDTSSLKALERWAKTLNDTLNSHTEMSSKVLTYSLHASVFLAETRTLAWLTVNTGQIKLNAAEKKKLATLLKQEIELASSCIQQFKQTFITTYSSSKCDNDKQRRSLQNIIENIELIKETERKISENETVSK